MHTRFSILLLTAILCLTNASRVTAQPEPAFIKANADFAAGHFPEAIKGYESLVKEHHWSASLFYNLGNAYFRVGDFGHAILNYERALALQPAQPEAQANLRLVRDQSRALELAQSWPEEHLAFLTANQYAILAAVAFWCAAFTLAGLVFAQRRPVVWIFILVLLCAITAGSVFAISAFESGRADRDQAIVTAQKVQARLATAENAGTVLVLPPGSEIKILSTRGQWSYAALPNDLRGWIPADSAERVRL
ncbi:MAG: tetratricopeptide repeat protein [Chthoniobacterales bacterium]|nr:tetratricopeptide repeat protein [Chthoniobacterales bacterium]